MALIPKEDQHVRNTRRVEIARREKELRLLAEHRADHAEHIVRVARAYTAARRDLAAADGSGFLRAHVECDDAWHDLLMALDECDLCEDDSCPRIVNTAPL